MKVIGVIIFSTITSLIVLWLFLILCLAVLRPNIAALRDAARIVPDSVRLISRLSRERSMKRSLRIRLVLLGVYLAIPLDIVPDFIPILGFADDAIVIGLVLRTVIRRAGTEVVRSNWPGSESGLQTLGKLCRIPDLVAS